MKTKKNAKKSRKKHQRKKRKEKQNVVSEVRRENLGDELRNTER